ncbi:MAG: SusD/RagB family nutrient-binding outer membrane lipoprotein, partial [Sediminibacterium sp.]|nr:SusD/RagB family nutrient-binding outer membrane lipoprotein [Sediminibacterium sp.]
MALGDVTNARNNLEAGIRRSIAKVQGYGATISFTYPTTDTNYLLNTTSKINRYVKIVMSRFDEAANNNAKMDILQKEYYIALWGNGIEPYNNYRRTGYPSNMQRPVTGDVSASNFFMRSFFYPSTYANRNINFSGQKDPGVKVNKVFWDNNSDNFIK